ncbi:MAG: GNAT family N-acetyltransferase [Oscillospiraceae bacterium]|nr:GNAT family N-acetyltransferase [Oscillospiraceae bacterium]
MAIQGIKQPAVIQIDETLRLRKYHGLYHFALKWYQNEDTVYLVDGKRDLYTMERLQGMYEYLNNAGELYFIEILENGTYQPIGDVTFWQEDLPIVIGDPRYRGRGIGRKIISAMIRRGRELGFGHLLVNEIYNWNEGSRRCFESMGFRAYEKTVKGARYRLTL